MITHNAICCVKPVWTSEGWHKEHHRCTDDKLPYCNKMHVKFPGFKGGRCSNDGFLRVITLCRMICLLRIFGGTCCLHLQNPPWITYLHKYLRTYLLPYSLTPWRRVVLEKFISSHLVKKFPSFYGTRSFITAFTSTRHVSLSWTRPIQSIRPPPQSHSWRYILILFSHLFLGPSRALFPQISPPKPYMHLSSPPMCYTQSLHHSSRFDHLNNIWCGIQIIKLLSM